MSNSPSKQRTFKKIILEDLERRGLPHLVRKIKSITYETFSMGNAVRVDAVELFHSERKQLDSILQEYAYGRFDGMTDSSWSERDEKKERQAKYVTLNNRFSPAIESALPWEKLSRIESYAELIKALEEAAS